MSEMDSLLEEPRHIWADVKTWVNMYIYVWYMCIYIQVSLLKSTRNTNLHTHAPTPIDIFVLDATIFPEPFDSCEFSGDKICNDPGHLNYDDASQDACAKGTDTSDCTGCGIRIYQSNHRNLHTCKHYLCSCLFPSGC